MAGKKRQTRFKTFDEYNSTLNKGCPVCGKRVNFWNYAHEDTSQNYGPYRVILSCSAFEYCGWTGILFLDSPLEREK